MVENPSKNDIIAIFFIDKSIIPTTIYNNIVVGKVNYFTIINLTTPTSDPLAATWHI